MDNEMVWLNYKKANFQNDILILGTDVFLVLISLKKLLVNLHSLYH
jgi:hypothetical protein